MLETYPVVDLPPMPEKLILYQPLPASSRTVTAAPLFREAMASLELPGPERTFRPLPAPEILPDLLMGVPVEGVLGTAGVLGVEGVPGVEGAVGVRVLPAFPWD